MAYENWGGEDLVRRIIKLEREVEELETKLAKALTEKDHLNFRIDTELDPRIESEKRAYDRFITNPERGRECY